jgi:CPA2 family monovalent cation:H+ antiporter-2
MMLITPLLSGYGEGMLPQALMVLAKSAFMVAIIVGTAWFAVPRLLDYIVGSRTRELFLLTIIVLCLGIAWLTSLSGLSLALGAFIAGLVISESEYSHQAMAEVLPFRDSFNSLFFVSVGMLMDVRVVLHYPMFILALVAAVLLGKFLTSALPVLAAGQAPRSAILAGISLAQVGEFAFILAQEGQEAGLLEETAYQLFLSVSVLTMVATPLLMQAAPRLAKRAEAFQRLRHWFPGRTSAHFDQGKARHLRIKDHVIIAGYGLNGRNLARVLSEMEIPYAALDLDAEKVRRESKKGVNLYYGDTTNPAVLRHLRIDDARVFVVAISDPFSARQAVRIGRGLNPSLHIVVRTRYLRELEELHQLGADEIVPEEFETSIEIFTLVLRTYKMPQELIAQKAEQVRREGYALLRRNMSDVAPRIVGGVLADVEVESCRIEPDSPAVGKTLGQMSIWPRTGASVIALTREGTTTSNPSEKTRLLAGDIVVLFGTREQIIRAIGLLFNI